MTTHNEHDRHNGPNKAQQDQGREVTMANALATSANTSIDVSIDAANTSVTDNLLDFPLQPPPEYSASERQEFLRLSVEHGHIAAEWNDLVESCGGTMCKESKEYATEKVRWHSGEARRLLVLGRPELAEQLIGEGAKVKV